MISKNYNFYPYICENMEISSIHQKCLAEIDTFFHEDKHAPLKEHSLNKWYSEKQFRYWGRRNITGGIQFTRITMMVETHWLFLKRQYLLTHNRPRADFVVSLSNSRLM